MKGSEFVKKASKLAKRSDVEQYILDLAVQGHCVPWPLVKVHVTTDTYFFAAMDYFAIGETSDFVRVPMSPLLAQRLCDMFQWTMPTSRMVDHIWCAAETQLAPIPMTASNMKRPPNAGRHWPYDGSMMTVERYALHNQMVEDQLTKSGKDLVGLLAGHKKDVVLSNRLERRPTRLGFYGWHRLNGTPIQGPAVNVGAHVNTYYDYSHGFRACGPKMVCEGEEALVLEVLSDPKRCHYLYGEPGDDGPLRVLRYPGVGIAPQELDIYAEVDREPDPPDTLPGVPPPAKLPHIEFVQAKNYTPRNRTKVDLIIIHTAEMAEHPQSAENLAAWCSGPQAPRASWHYAVDGDSITQSVKETDRAWHCKHGNHRSIGIEHAGYARQDYAGWHDEYSQDMLRLSAALTADICKRWNIPVEYVDEEGLRNNGRGITYHSTVTKAFKVVGGHYDPGDEFPLEQYLAMVRAAMEG